MIPRRCIQVPTECDAFRTMRFKFEDLAVYNRLFDCQKRPPDRSSVCGGASMLFSNPTPQARGSFALIILASLFLRD